MALLYFRESCASQTYVLLATENGGGGAFLEPERDTVQQQSTLGSRDGKFPELDGCAHRPHIPCLTSVRAESSMQKR